MASLRPFPFQQVDVFSSVPFKGNPVAVVFDGDSLTPAEMQAIAKWTNLSETVFVCRPTHAEADYRLRLFTPNNELPFAGHPTIGTAHAVRRRGVTGRTRGCLVQECGKGLVTIRAEGERLYLALPTPAFRAPNAEQLRSVAEALGVAVGDIRHHSIVDVGPVWLTAQLRDAEQVLSLRPDLTQLANIDPTGITGVTVFGLYASGHVSDVEVRSFAPADGVPEDPVCGSGNGCVAAVIRRDAIFSRDEYSAGQGRCVGRDGRIHIRFDHDGTIWVGGDAVTCVDGELHA